MAISESKEKCIIEKKHCGYLPHGTI